MESTVISEQNRFESPGGDLPSAGLHARKKRFFWRLLKISLAIFIMIVAIMAILSYNIIVSSNNAIVSAYIFSVRSPINGYVNGLQTRVGEPVSAGKVLAYVVNPRVDDQRLVDLEQLAARQRAELDAHIAERDRLQSIRDDLLRRVSEYENFEVEYFRKRTEEVAFLFQSKEEQHKQAFHDVSRDEQLGREGWVPLAEVERLRSNFDITKWEAQAQLADVGTLQIQLEAARKGIFLENGSNDVPYSRQRADEVILRIAEVQHEIELLTAAQDETRGRLEAERRRIDLLRSATLTAPSDGMVWKLGASNGEFVSAGDNVVDLVDCRDAFIIARIPQDRFDDIVVGKTAHFRFSGDKQDKIGRIISVTGDLDLIKEQNLATAPSNERYPTAIVRIRIEPSNNVAGDCAVGRTVHVWMPVSQENSLVKLFRIIQQISPF